MADAGDAVMSGTDRAAILLLALGEKEAATVLRHVAPHEAQKLGTAMSGLNELNKDQVSHVLGELVSTVDEQAGVSSGSESYIRTVLTDAFGESKANALLDRIFVDRNTRGLETLEWMEDDAIADMIRHEHPQIIAIVLAYLEPERSASILARLPEENAADVMMRIARLSDVQQSALQELEDIVARQHEGRSRSKPSRLGGERVAATIVNALGAGRDERVLEQMQLRDEELVVRIQELMFVFEGLMDVDDRGIQSLLREISSDHLSLALKGAEPEMRDKIFRNMSKRAAQMLSEDMEAKGPVRVSDVEEAQKEILVVARRMAEAGDIVLGGGGNDFV